MTAIVKLMKYFIFNQDDDEDETIKIIASSSSSSSSPRNSPEVITSEPKAMTLTSEGHVAMGMTSSSSSSSISDYEKLIPNGFVSRGDGQNEMIKKKTINSSSSSSPSNNTNYYNLNDNNNNADEEDDDRIDVIEKPEMKSPSEYQTEKREHHVGGSKTSKTNGSNQARRGSPVQYYDYHDDDYDDDDDEDDDEDDEDDDDEDDDGLERDEDNDNDEREMERDGDYEECYQRYVNVDKNVHQKGNRYYVNLPGETVDQEGDKTFESVIGQDDLKVSDTIGLKELTSYTNDQLREEDFGMIGRQETTDHQSQKSTPRDDKLKLSEDEDDDECNRGHDDQYNVCHEHAIDVTMETSVEKNILSVDEIMKSREVSYKSEDDDEEDDDASICGECDGDDNGHVITYGEIMVDRWKDHKVTDIKNVGDNDDYDDVKMRRRNDIEEFRFGDDGEDIHVLRRNDDDNDVIDDNAHSDDNHRKREVNRYHDHHHVMNKCTNEDDEEDDGYDDDDDANNQAYHGRNNEQGDDVINQIERQSICQQQSPHHYVCRDDGGDHDDRHDNDVEVDEEKLKEPEDKVLQIRPREENDDDYHHDADEDDYNKMDDDEDDDKKEEDAYYDGTHVTESSETKSSPLIRSSKSEDLKPKPEYQPPFVRGICCTEPQQAIEILRTSYKLNDVARRSTKSIWNTVDIPKRVTVTGISWAGDANTGNSLDSRIYSGTNRLSEMRKRIELREQKLNDLTRKIIEGRSRSVRERSKKKGIGSEGDASPDKPLMPSEHCDEKKTYGQKLISKCDLGKADEITVVKEEVVMEPMPKKSKKKKRSNFLIKAFRSIKKKLHN